jgi:hypothetical protein
MNDSVVAITLRKRNAKDEVRVKVEISIHPGATAKPPQIPLERQCLLKLGVDCSDSPEDMYIKCGIAAITGVEYVRTYHPTPFNYQITVLEGKNLGDDDTIGFCLAAFRAAVRAAAVIVPPPEGSDDWVEV